MTTPLAEPTERIRLVDCEYLGAVRASDTDDDDARAIKLLGRTTVRSIRAAHDIGKRTTVAGADLHAMAVRFLAAQGRDVDTCSQAEYVRALEFAEEELGDSYDPQTDVLVV